MKAVNNYVLVKPIIEKEKKSSGGVLITGTLNKEIRYDKGRVLSVGNLVEGLSDGDVIYYDKIAGHEVEYKKSIFKVIRIQDVVMVE